MIGFASARFQPAAQHALLKGCDIRGVYWGEFTARETEAHRQNLAELMDWAKSGTLSVHIYAKYAVENFRDAFEAIASARRSGKPVASLLSARINPAG